MTKLKLAAALAATVALGGCATLPTQAPSADECAILRAAGDGLWKGKDPSRYGRVSLSDHTASAWALKLPRAADFPRHVVDLRACHVPEMLPNWVELVAHGPTDRDGMINAFSTPNIAADGATAVVGYSSGSRYGGALLHLVRDRDGWRVENVEEWITVA
ncbi:hypothetical protein [Caulobacter sp. 17J80-11]|uniref:hypothetical protein n=1 Tax=Caulobacter sp. 17J80-11 TaxID=2763502 RepID=UPI00165351A1|nr:hypothetical protein [Caulobacter sp. 17J80-11]MBC6981332.1 hypothetical protein [Caulobacter sp. 17J80-11]